MQCPDCSNEALHAETVTDIEIDRCPACHGIWLDALELEKLVDCQPKDLLAEDRAFEVAPGDQPAVRECPRCVGAKLIKLNSRLHPGTIIDSCTVCYGNWLDAGELAKLAGKDLGGSLRRLFGG